jgi:hypothetical protein
MSVARAFSFSFALTPGGLFKLTFFLDHLKSTSAERNFFVGILSGGDP